MRRAAGRRRRPRIGSLEQLWNRDLSGYDAGRPAARRSTRWSASNLIAKGRASVRHVRDPVATARSGGSRPRPATCQPGADHRGHRAAVLHRLARPRSPTINDLVQADAGDGFILVPHITPDGLDPFVDQVVPLLQERGVFRADYTGTTLRDHLGLGPARRRPGATGATG